MSFRGQETVTKDLDRVGSMSTDYGASMKSHLEIYKKRLKRERQARLYAEKMAGEKSRELALKCLELEQTVNGGVKVKRWAEQKCST